MKFGGKLALAFHGELASLTLSQPKSSRLNLYNVASFTPTAHVLHSSHLETSTLTFILINIYVVLYFLVVLKLAATTASRVMMNRQQPFFSLSLNYKLVQLLIHHLSKKMWC